MPEIIIYKCDECGSTNVCAEYSVMLPMNKTYDFAYMLEHGYYRDYHWCEDCGEECNTVDSKG